MRQHCELKITTGIRDGYHYLEEKFYTQPFGLLRYDARSHDDPWLRYMIRCASPGILGGDFWDMKFRVIEGTSLQLESQAYSRIHEMKEGDEAKQEVTVDVEENGYFQYIPHPTVPHKNSIFKSKNTINLKKSSKLIWGEVVTCGRKLYGDGEVFEFTSLSNQTTVFVEGEMIFKDRLFLDPKKNDLKALGQFEGYTHQATMIVYNEDQDFDQITEVLIENVKDENEVEYGITTTIKDAIIIRVVGNGGEQLYKILKRIEQNILENTIPALER